MEEAEELSQEQVEKLVQFQEVTGVDTTVARLELSQHNWNVEAAVQDHLALRDSPDRLETPVNRLNRHLADYHATEQAGANVVGSRDNSSSSGGSSSSNSRGQGGRINGADVSTNGVGSVADRRGNTRPLGGVGGNGGPMLALFPSRPVEGFFGWSYYIFTLPLRIAYSSISSLIVFIYRMILPYPRRPDPLGDVVQFIREYEEEYGTLHPGFFQGSYSQALSHSKTELKFLLVYLHCIDHQDTPSFCRETLSDPGFVEYINSSMVFWGCSVNTAEGYRVSQALRENAYPFLAVIVLRDNKMTVVSRIERPQQEPQDLVTRLQKIVTENEAYLVVARAERQERELTAALRQEQDVAYLQSLRADQEKARRKQQEQEEIEKKLEEEREEEQQKIRDKENIQNLKLEYLDKVPEEPTESSTGVVHILIKLPVGSRLERRFLLSDSLKCLYYYIFCHPESPDRFEVTTNFPRKIVPCKPEDDQPDPLTFEQFKLPQRSTLFVTDLDA